MAAIGRWFCKCFMGTSGVSPQYVCVALKIHMQKYLSSINAVGNKKTLSIRGLNPGVRCLSSPQDAGVARSQA